MSNKQLLMITSIMGAAGCFLPWLGGPFGITMSGIEGDGVFVLVALLLVAVIIYSKDELDGAGWGVKSMIGLSLIASVVTVYTTFVIAFKVGLDADVAPMISVQFGLMLSLFGSVSSLLLSLQHRMEKRNG